jgi:NADPH:quinone reductase-like Zn-dependent oxidoreductase
MKAIILNGTGGVDTLEMKEVSKPLIHENEVLVEIKSLSINPVDIKTRTGKGVYGRIKDDHPIILGWDISGIIKETGENVRKFKLGDEVFGMINFPGHGKAYAEYAAAPEDHLALKPKNITHAKAASGSLAALTAWQALVNVAKVKSGDKVLIHAAAGGVGHYAVQIAKHLGAFVIGTSSNENKEFLIELGVNEHINYKTEPFENKLKEIDVVLDPLGGEVTKKSYAVLKNGGRLVSIVGGVKEDDHSEIQRKNLSANNYLVQSNGEEMQQLAKLFKEGKLKSIVSHPFSFDKIADAHRQIETGKTRGKVVVNIS